LAAVSRTIEPLPTPRAARSAPAPTVEAIVTPAPVTADELSLDETDFRFVDPPEPGAHARVEISVTNHGPVPSGRILLGIPATCVDSSSTTGRAQSASEARTDEAGLEPFSFPPMGGGATASFELHVTAVGEGTLAPTVKVLLGDEPVGEAAPSTFAPTPR